MKLQNAPTSAADKTDRCSHKVTTPNMFAFLLDIKDHSTEKTGITRFSAKAKQRWKRLYPLHLIEIA